MNSKLWTMSALAGVLVASALPCRAEVLVSAEQAVQISDMKDQFTKLKQASEEDELKRALLAAVVKDVGSETIVEGPTSDKVETLSNRCLPGLTFDCWKETLEELTWTFKTDHHICKVVNQRWRDRSTVNNSLGVSAECYGSESARSGDLMSQFKEAKKAAVEQARR